MASIPLRRWRKTWRKLYETKLFANIRPIKERTGENKVKVYFYVTEFATTIQEIAYPGAKHLKPDELETLTGLRRCTLKSDRQPNGRECYPAPLRGNGPLVCRGGAGRGR